jgi:hypothetical protein
MGSTKAGQPNGERQAFMCAALSDFSLRCFALLSLIWAILPSDGIRGLELCWFKAWTGLPCPGCGMTRSGSSLLHGDLLHAWNYNPFGLLIAPIIFGMGLLAILPKQVRERLRAGLISRADVLHWTYVTLLLFLVSFGLVRTICVYQGWVRFPFD